MNEDMEFDRALVSAAFELAGERGWSRVTPAAAARHGGLKLDEARARFLSRNAILLRFGRIADMAALNGADSGSSERDRLFDSVMRRIDVLQAHRSGVLALLRALPADPGLSLCLADASRRSMAWLLEGAGISSTGLRGFLRTKGMLAVWLWTVRAWQRDDSEELSATMAALDQALQRAEQAEASVPKFGGRAPWDPANSMPENDDEDISAAVPTEEELAAEMADDVTGVDAGDEPPPHLPVTDAPPPPPPPASPPV